MLVMTANLAPGTVRLLYIHTKKCAQMYIPCVLQSIETAVFGGSNKETHRENVLL